MKASKYSLFVMIAMLCLSVSCKKTEVQDATTASMSSDFASSPDTTKVKMLIERRMPMDSLARYLGMAAIGEIKGVNISNFSDIDAYIYTHKSMKEYDVYALELQKFSEELPLVSKYKFMKNTSTGDPDKIGYQLGLQYINSVMENKLSIGKVDKEIADFRRACGEDEDTYNRFLKGFAIAISTRSPGEVPADIVSQYGSASQVKK